MNRRHVNIALVFIWALSHGIWMGAGMHSLSALGAHRAGANANKGGAVACAGCRSFADKAGNESLNSSSDCSVCQLSTVLPEAAVVALPLFDCSPIVFVAPLPFNGIAPNFVACPLPPTHAPPA